MDARKRPLSERNAPDPARTYERARPEAESLNGKLTREKSIPAESPDRIDDAAPNKQPSRQLNADDVINAEGGPMPETDPANVHRVTRRELAEQRRGQHRNRRRRAK